MLEILFTAIVYLNLPVAVASFIFAFILLRRSKNNPIYFNFGLANFSLGLWAFDIFLMFNVSVLGVLLGSFSYLFGMWILHFFLIFTYHFPVLKKGMGLKTSLLYLCTFIVSLLIFVPGLLAISTELDFPYLYFQVSPVGNAIFSIYFSLLAIFSFRNLISHYLISDGVFKAKLRKIIIGTGIAVMFNFIFSINIFFFTTFDFTAVGVLFVSGVLLYIYSILFSKK